MELHIVVYELSPDSQIKLILKLNVMNDYSIIEQSFLTRH